mgnify:CR=1 FL=1
MKAVKIHMAATFRVGAPMRMDVVTAVLADRTEDISAVHIMRSKYSVRVAFAWRFVCVTPTYCSARSS